MFSFQNQYFRADTWDRTKFAGYEFRQRAINVGSIFLSIDTQLAINQSVYRAGASPIRFMPLAALLGHIFRKAAYPELTDDEVTASERMPQMFKANTRLRLIWGSAGFF